MRAVIICGGSIRDYGYINAQIRDDDYIICADSGYDRAVIMGLRVDVLIGDLDSIAKIPDDVKIIRFPARKNLTDFEIAMKYAREKGFKDFLLIASTGNRLDHTLTNIFFLEDCLMRGENVLLIDDNNKILITDSELRINEPVGTTVSLIPIREKCQGVTTVNMEYPLNDAVLYMGKGVGVSNITTDTSAGVSLKSGVLLVITVRNP